MSPSRWGKVFLMLGMVVGVMAIPHQSSPFFPSSSMSLARQRRLAKAIDNRKVLCLLKTIDEGGDVTSCNSSSDEPTSPSFPSPSVTFARKRRQLGDSIDDSQLLCLLTASNEGRGGSQCKDSLVENSSPTQTHPITPSPKSPAALPPPDLDVAPAPSCRCVPHWQCKDKESSKITDVQGDGLSSFVLDLRSNFGCGAPEEVCCVEVDISAQPPTVPPEPSLCGERNSLGVGTTFLGFEDQQSQFGEFPWTVAIVTSRNYGSPERPLFIGGGSLIDPQVVLTVAHNMINFTADQLKIRLGEWNLATQTEVVPHQEIQVSRILLHPGYHKVNQYYNVALLLLDRPAVLGATVNTICLPSPRQDYLSDECVVSGWGKKDFDKQSRFQEVMKRVSMPLVGHAQCQAALQGTRLGPRFILHDSFLCAGGQKEGQDACTGDGGSPLTCRLQSDPQRYVQVGVVSWGIGCGRLGLPGVYTDVLKARPWIEQVIGEVNGNAGGTEGGVPFDLRTPFRK